MANPRGAKIFCTRVEHPEWYGVVELAGDRVARIVEKPKQPKSNLVAIGLYLVHLAVRRIKTVGTVTHY